MASSYVNSIWPNQGPGEFSPPIKAERIDNWEEVSEQFDPTV